jgi:hypothetical protein
VKKLLNERRKFRDKDKKDKFKAKETAEDLEL